MRENEGVEAESTKKKKGLLDLPTELWIRIVKLAVEFEEPIDITVRSEGSAISKTEPGITAVSHKIRSECLLHYYSNNIFYCHGSYKQGSYRGYFGTNAMWRNYAPRARRELSHLHDWLEAIGRETVEVLQTVYYVNSTPTSFGEEYIKLRGQGRIRVRPVSREEYLQWTVDMAVPEEEWDVGIGCVAKVEMA